MQMIKRSDPTLVGIVIVSCSRKLLFYIVQIITVTKVIYLSKRSMLNGH
jgi:hypothetical protein